LKFKGRAEKRWVWKLGLDTVTHFTGRGDLVEIMSKVPDPIKEEKETYF